MTVTDAVPGSKPSRATTCASAANGDPMLRHTRTSTDVSSVGANFCSTDTILALAASCAAASAATTPAPNVDVRRLTRMCPAAFAAAVPGSFTSGTHSSRAAP